MAGKLYLVGTPIGNLGDFSSRAQQALTGADFIAAEDTRVTLRLLNHFGIKKPMISYFEHNKFQRGEEIVSRLEAGETCALVTDAGMPAISDPGEDLVALCATRGIEVVAVPGPCAAVTALALSGLPTGRFCFEGFLSVNKKNRFAHLEAVKDEPRTLIFYEAPHKLRATLRDMLTFFGNRRVALVREMTKIHEEVLRTTLEQAAEAYAHNEPRGEFVLVVEGKPSAAQTLPARMEEPSPGKNAAVADDAAVEAAEALVERYLSEGMTRPEAVKRAARETGVNRSGLYKKSAGPS